MIFMDLPCTMSRSHGFYHNAKMTHSSRKPLLISQTSLQPTSRKHNDATYISKQQPLPMLSTVWALLSQIGSLMAMMFDCNLESLISCIHNKSNHIPMQSVHSNNYFNEPTLIAPTMHFDLLQAHGTKDGFTNHGKGLPIFLTTTPSTSFPLIPTHESRDTYAISKPASSFSTTKLATPAHSRERQLQYAP